MSDDALPEPDRLEGAPHPRDAATLIGQGDAEAAFLDAFASGRLHHGWMITGPRGIGKATLAWRIARFLLADQPDGGIFGSGPTTTLDMAADHPDARLAASGAHPRLFVLRRAWDDKTKKLKSVITVDETRKLAGFFAMSAVDGGRRVVIVDAADEMNQQSANALLKLLEEPPARTTLLLIAHQPSRLLPTIRSRCRSLRLHSLTPDDLEAALAQIGAPTASGPALAALAGGSVGEAIRLQSHGGATTYAEIIKLLSGLPGYDRPAALKLAESCVGARNAERFSMMLDLFDTVLSRLARAGLTGPPEPQAAPGEALLLARLSPHADAARRWATLQQELSGRARHGRAVNLDPASLILDMISRIEDAARSISNP